MEGDQKKSEDNEMYEATAGWDSYVSGLWQQGVLWPMGSRSVNAAKRLRPNATT